MMTNEKTNTILLIFVIGLLYLNLIGCSTVASQPAPVSLNTTTPQQVEAQPTQTKTVVVSTPTSTPVLPASTPTATVTNTSEPTPAPMILVKEENGWVTYRNEVIGYEISAPESYEIRGSSPQVGEIGSHLLGPAVPDEEIINLISRYYGDSLWIWMSDTDADGQLKPGFINITAYDILVKELGGTPGSRGMGDYQLTARQETLHIDWQTYPVTFTVMARDNQPIGELAVLYLEKDGIEFMFGCVQPKDDPEAYQTYLKEVLPELREIIETYRKLPDETSMVNIPSVNVADLTDPSPRSIAQALFEQYLTAFQENPFDSQAKLAAYKIDEVEIPAKWEPCAELNKVEFIAAIAYSVKPEYWPPERWVEDGYLTFDHWIKRKSASIAVFRSGQDYKMELLDAPICAGF